MPAATGDIQLSLAQLVPVQGAVLVTTPQDVAVADVRRALRMFETVAIPVLGVVENMSYFIAPDTGARYDIFGPSYADQVAELANAPVLARIPITPRLMELADAGRIEEVDDPICADLARSLLGALATMPRAKETISLI